MRYDCPTDRLDFERWLTQRPCASCIRYWRREDNGTVVIEIVRGDSVLRYDVTRESLFLARGGWRKIVARVIRHLRYAHGAMRRDQRVLENIAAWGAPNHARHPGKVTTA